ncbi:cytochrome P450 [Streptomyces ipomoeae]|uniref:Unspecific monooxygenase n=2 Tax=Streptomyces ipomoeae TaxID=103232 RepID=L1KYQ0_9ACTN|nr:cytochrome P450 [Streptomyces ipomoeae]EKX65747.1 unspecific monooxygenase [Streptomyces ipomoeae 91-03]MDX2693312.1 cytochrome P450 [Streptomyces ipomoeae]MDX2838903.1 cytochrome P450 [Streptomyces ipomoeae]MDX2874533.1 cytochrome P450 [Streptomyces ipomoeae]TQE15426.1 cytochrome P450 [Streptomyces ipomoeae]
MSTTTPSESPLVDHAELIADPYAVYARLREAGPVHRVTGTDGLPAWLVTRYDDVRQALADPRLSLDKRNATPGGYHGLALPPALDANLLNMDPPDHTRIRRLVSKAFTPRRIALLREPMRKTADLLLDAIAPHGHADLITSYAAPLPITVICELLGVAPHDRQDFRSWTDALIAPDPAQLDKAKGAVRSMLAFFTQLLADKRAAPADDLLSALIAVRDDEDRLSEDELMSLAFLILFAGYENTVHLIGNAVLALLSHPDQLAALRADPSRLTSAVEELARYDGAAPLAIRRFPTEDITIGGVTIPAGETVLLSLAAAHRDPSRFADPDRLDLGRDATGHLALGHGIHYCLGAPLARMETEIALAALFERFPGLALDVPLDELRWRPSMRARGLLSLPVRY